MASHLKVPVRELRQRITFLEFCEWMEFLSLEEDKDTKQDYYLAQIAAEIRRSFVKDPKTVKVKDFLLQRKVQERTVGKAEKSKQFWGQALNMDLGRKK